jgi:hypothetical protein
MRAEQWARQEEEKKATAAAAAQHQHRLRQHQQRAHAAAEVAAGGGGGGSDGSNGQLLERLVGRRIRVSTQRFLYVCQYLLPGKHFLISSYHLLSTLSPLILPSES